jgi:HSP20 family molecular chaperone IbpA
MDDVTYNIPCVSATASNITSQTITGSSAYIGDPPQQTWTSGQCCAPLTTWYSYSIPQNYKWFKHTDSADIEVDLPGYDPATITVQYGGMAAAGYYGIMVRAERSGNQSTTFYTSIIIDEDEYDVDSIKATCKHGMLKISMNRIKPLQRDIKVDLL